MNAPTKPPTTSHRVSRPAAGSFARSRSARSSWLALAGSVSLHAAVFAIAAHFMTGSGGGEAQPAATDAGDELSLAVKIASPAQRQSTQKSMSVIRNALPAPRQRVMAAAQTDFVLPPPEPQVDLPDPRLHEKTAQSAASASADAPPSKKTASHATRRGGGSTSKGSSGFGLGSGNATAPRPITTRIPVYPHLAKKRGEQGMVLVRVRVNEAGRVESSTLYRSSGHADLDEAAVACVWKWSFAPGQSGGRAVESSAVVRVSFRLEG